MRVGRLAAQGDVPPGVLVSGLHVLVLPPITWKVRTVSTKLKVQPTAFDQIFRPGPIQLIPLFPLEPVRVGRFQVKMRPFQLVVLFIMVDYVRNAGKLLISLSVYGVLVHVRFDYVKLAQVSSAVALLLQPLGRVQVLEVTLG